MWSVQRYEAARKIRMGQRIWPENVEKSEQATEKRREYGIKNDTRRKLTHAIFRPNKMNEAVKALYKKREWDERQKKRKKKKSKK